MTSSLFTFQFFTLKQCKVYVRVHEKMHKLAIVVQIGTYKNLIIKTISLFVQNNLK